VEDTVFERFTEAARQSAVRAQDCARELGHDRVTTAHLLVGLTRVDNIGGIPNIARDVLESLDVTGDLVFEAARDELGTGPGTPNGQIPFTPGAKQALELSLREALSLGHNYIGTEHILLGLVRQGGSDSYRAHAANILEGLGADKETVRNAVISRLSGKPKDYDDALEEASLPKRRIDLSKQPSARPDTEGFQELLREREAKKQALREAVTTLSALVESEGDEAHKEALQTIAQYINRKAA
jgi:ATP-dependent Clp protease ATP-binding subunit ClpA